MRSRIETPRLVLRARRREDAGLLKEALDASLPELRATMPWASQEPSPVETIAERAEGSARAFAAGEDFAFAIFDRGETRALGGCGLHPRQGPGVLEIGYWIRTDATGRGLATEVSEALLEEGLAQAGVDEIQIRCDPRNVRSAAIPRRLGFDHRTTLAGDTTAPDGSPRDTMVWAMTRARYADSRAGLEPGGEDDVEPHLALLEEAAAWLWARGIRQWEPGTMAGRRALLAQAARAGELHVVRRGGVLAGGLVATRRRDPYWTPPPRPAWTVHALVVSRAAAGHGLARRMLARLDGLARDAGIGLLRLDCWDGNDVLRRFYRAAGYRELHAVGGVTMRLRLFERTLE